MNSESINTNRCIQCDQKRSGHSHMILFGDWDEDSEGFSRPPVIRPLCNDCFNEDYRRDIGAYLEIENSHRLWNILEASDGKLVADFKHMAVGSRSFARVFDDELQVMKVVTRRVDEETLTFDAIHVDMNDNDFFNFVNPDSRDIPTIVILKPVEETPFADVRNRGGKSHKLTSFYHAQNDSE